jgi:hypothetical protein
MLLFYINRTYTRVSTCTHNPTQFDLIFGTLNPKPETQNPTQFDLKFDIPVSYPATSPELALPEIDGFFVVVVCVSVCLCLCLCVCVYVI